MTRLAHIVGFVLLLSMLLMAGCDNAEMNQGAYDDSWGGEGGAEPTEPTEPTEPSEPSEPTEPIEQDVPGGMG